MRSIEELWLDCLQRVLQRAAHEVKGSLNGLALNLEVVRSRSARGDAPSSALKSFAESADVQLAEVIRLTEALLAVGRTGRTPADVGVTAKQLSALIGPATKTLGGRLSVDIASSEPLESPASVSAVRFAIADRLLAATEAAGGSALTCRCVADSTTGAPRVEITANPHSALAGVKPLLADATDALTALGIRSETDGHGIFIMFPG